MEELQKKGYECRDCRGNFIFVKPHHNAKEIAKRLEEEKQVLVHPYGNELLKDYLRVSVGSKKPCRYSWTRFSRWTRTNSAGGFL